ncbi:hypothetical protein V9T40_005927 [Parthenolecanium corni]|uniref:F-box domain-containing protein n=1 Tax=Parthenolecanium corni TaxID=536013 RepID=A0AAN9TX52_9HEMI
MNTRAVNRINLLDEIWSEIFTYLPAKDRLSIRLTCSRFNRLCDEISILENEVMVFHGDINARSALQVLTHSSRKVRNIKFIWINIREEALFFPFFDKHGGDIHSLSFDDCRFGPRLFGGILERSKTLHNFVLELKRFSYTPKFIISGELYQPLNDIAVLIERSVTLDKVENLTVNMLVHPTLINTRNMSNQLFLQFFALFPQVRRVDLQFDIYYILSTQLSTNPSDIMSNDQFTLSCIYDRILAMRHQLEKLRLQFNFHNYSRTILSPSRRLYGGNFRFRLQPCLTLQSMEKITQIEMSNLKELSLNWIDSSHSFTTNPFQVFRNVTHFDYDFDNPSIPPSTAMHLLLNTITGLRSLTFSAHNFCMSKQCFEALVRSQLTSLKIIEPENFYALKVDFEPSSLDATLHPNYVLKRLSINEKYAQPLTLLFSTYFRSLERIIFPEVCEETLHTIVKYQRNLRRLRLYNGARSHRQLEHCIFRDHSVYKEYLENDDLSQHRLLPNLTHLDIDEDKIGLTNFLLSEFVFPRLQSLVIKIKEIGEEDLKQFWHTSILSKIPHLSYIELQLLPAIHSFQQVLVLVRSVSTLRQIFMTDETPQFHASEYRQLFAENPSLRTVHHNYITYFYDVTTKVVKDIPNRDIFVHKGTESWEGIPNHYLHFSESH